MMIKRTILWLICLVLGISTGKAQTDIYGEARLMNEKADGYRGIWYYIDNAGQAGKVMYTKQKASMAYVLENLQNRHSG